MNKEQEEKLERVVNGCANLFKQTTDKVLKRTVDLICTEKIYEMVNMDSAIAKGYIAKYERLKKS